MSIKDDVEDLCQIDDIFINEIFDYFFDKKNIEAKDLDFFDTLKHYDNFEIIKIEIKDWKTYDQFIEKALTKITNYYLDGETTIEWLSHDESCNYVFKQLNHYIPIEWVSFSYIRTLRWLEIWNQKFNNWDEFIAYFEQIESHKDRLKLFENIPFNTINVLDLNIDDSYVLSNWAIRTTRQILWYLHWDIWEFILFLLTEWVLKSPLLFSKVNHCKSSPWDKVKWSDWIHISIDEDNNVFYSFLESKINKDFSSSLSQVIESNKEFLSNIWEWDINNEISILFSNKDTIDKKYKFLFQNGFIKTIVPYLNDKPSQDNLPFDIVCLLSYNCNNYKSFKEGIFDRSTYIESSVLNKIESVLLKYKWIEDKLYWRKIRIFMLPLVNEIDFIKIFLDNIKIK